MFRKRCVLASLKRHIRACLASPLANGVILIINWTLTPMVRRDDARCDFTPECCKRAPEGFFGKHAYFFRDSLLLRDLII